MVRAAGICAVLIARMPDELNTRTWAEVKALRSRVSKAPSWLLLSAATAAVDKTLACAVLRATIWAMVNADDCMVVSAAICAVFRAAGICAVVSAEITDGLRTRTCAVVRAFRSRVSKAAS